MYIIFFLSSVELSTIPGHLLKVVISDVRDGKFYQLPEKKNTAMGKQVQ